MGQSVSLFLVRAAGILIGGMLLFAAFNGARAQTADNYGLKRFSGDNYDTVPPGAGIPPVPAPQGYAPVPGSSVSPSGYYGTLNGAPASQAGSQVSSQAAYQPAPSAPMPAMPAQALPAQSAPVQPMPAQPVAYGYKPDAMAPVATTPYGYNPDTAVSASAPPPLRTAAADPYAYYQGVPGARENLDYVLGPGDKLRLTVFGETDLSGEFAVDGSGFVRLPLIGQVRAAGYTQQQLEQVIGSALAQGYLKSPRVSVEVSAYRPFYIIGAVNRPGQYAYVDHMNALNAVALAGGFTPTAVESAVFLRREGSNQEVEVPADRTTVIHPGDVINVHNTIFSDITNWIAPLSGVAASAATAAVIQ